MNTTNNQTEYYKKQILKLMGDIEDLRNRYIPTSRKQTFEDTFQDLTEQIWFAIDANDEHKLILLTEVLCVLLNESNSTCSSGCLRWKGFCNE